jgi:hypothetical protein
LSSIELRFFNDADSSQVEVEGEAFLFDYTAIRVQPGGDVIARRVNNEWLVGGDLFLKMECRGAVECLIDQNRCAEQREGPFDRVSLVDGVLTADDRPLAVLHRGRGWSSLAGDGSWSGFSLVPALRS